MRSIEIGERLGVGRLSEVYVSGDEGVIKLFHQGVPEGAAAREFENLSAAFARGLPVPRPQRMFEAQGRCGIRMARAAGENLLSLMLADAAAAAAGARLLADAHASIHAVPGDAMPSLVKRVRHALDGLSKRGEPGVAGLVERLASLPGGASLCHGDLHPGNLMFTGDRFMVLDWHDASCGPIEADIARTLVIVDFGRAGRIDDALRRVVADAYLERYLASSARTPDLELVDTWYGIMLAARLAEPVEDEQAAGIRAELANRIGSGNAVGPT